MNKALTMTLIAALSCATAACAVGPNKQVDLIPELEDVAPYPAAQEGQTRHVIWLAAKEHEDLLKVELLAGQVMLTDCNTRGLIATLTTKDLPGWGYTYYEVENVNGPVSTMMACPEGDEKEAFVAAQGDSFILRYNSKLPIVVYTPNDIEVRYRIWSGNQQLQSADPE